MCCLNSLSPAEGAGRWGGGCFCSSSPPCSLQRPRLLALCQESGRPPACTCSRSIARCLQVTWLPMELGFIFLVPYSCTLLPHLISIMRNSSTLGTCFFNETYKPSTFSMVVTEVDQRIGTTGFESQCCRGVALIWGKST
jgi:hypothetical protein